MVQRMCLPGLTMRGKLLMAHRDCSQLVVGSCIGQHASLGHLGHQVLSICGGRVSVYPAEAPAQLHSTSNCLTLTQKSLPGSGMYQAIVLSFGCHW